MGDVRDRSAVVAALARAHAQSGLSQAAFAHALGTSGSRWSTYVSGTTSPSAEFVVRAARVGGALGAARGQRLTTPPDAAMLVREHLSRTEEEWAWRALLQCRDHLAGAAASTFHDVTLADAWEARPGSTGSVEWDALLRVVLARAHDELALDAPDWTRGAGLPRPWVSEHPFLSATRVRQQTPDWLAKANIFVPARDLVTG